MDPSATDRERGRVTVGMRESWWKGRGAQEEVGGDKTCEREAHVCTQQLGVGGEGWRGEGAVTLSHAQARRIEKQGQKYGGCFGFLVD